MSQTRHELKFTDRVHATADLEGTKVQLSVSMPRANKMDIVLQTPTDTVSITLYGHEIDLQHITKS